MTHSRTPYPSPSHLHQLHEPVTRSSTDLQNAMRRWPSARIDASLRLGMASIPSILDELSPSQKGGSADLGLKSLTSYNISVPVTISHDFDIASVRLSASQARLRPDTTTTFRCFLGILHGRSLPVIATWLPHQGCIGPYLITCQPSIDLDVYSVPAVKYTASTRRDRWHATLRTP